MRLLIGATCVAVMAFVGYFFWNEYADAQARAKNAQAQERTSFEDNCAKLIANDPKYDAALISRLTPEELDAKQTECITYFETGKLPN